MGKKLFKKKKKNGTTAPCVLRRLLPGGGLRPSPNCDSQYAERPGGRGKPPPANRASLGTKRAASGGEAWAGPRQSGRGVVRGAGVRAGRGGWCVCGGPCCQPPSSSSSSSRRPPQAVESPAGDGGAGLSFSAGDLFCDGTGPGRGTGRAGGAGTGDAGEGRDGRERGTARPAEVSLALPNRVAELASAGRWSVVPRPDEGPGS